MSIISSHHRPALKRRLIAGDIPDWLRNHPRFRYLHAAVLSFPYWVARAELRRIDAEAKRLTRITGIPHQVDHIIPINHPRVCGLTVPGNLTILTQRMNGSKGGYWHEDETEIEQFDLFGTTAVEQYRLPLQETA